MELNWDYVIKYTRELMKNGRGDRKIYKDKRSSKIDSCLYDIEDTYLSYLYLPEAERNEVTFFDFESEVNRCRLKFNKNEYGTFSYIYNEEDESVRKERFGFLVISIVKALDEFNAKISSIDTSKIDETSTIEEFDLDSLVEEFNNKSEVKETESKTYKLKDYKKYYKPLVIICLASLFIYLINKSKK